jgi:hypothetical protein
MLWSRSKLPLNTHSHCFGKLNEDIVWHITEQVDTLRDLADLSLVSKQFCRVTTPQLYRCIEVKFSYGSHRRLVQRLATASTDLTRLIQDLKIGDVRKASVRSLLDLSMLVARLPNLRSIECIGSLVIPGCILSTLSAHRSGSYDNQKSRLQDVTTKVPQPVHGALYWRSTASSRLTSFTYHCGHENDLYDDFKVDLVTMMTKNRGLRLLKIDGYVQKDFPELIPTFRDSEFPKLTELILHIGEGLQLFDVFSGEKWWLGKPGEATSAVCPVHAGIYRKNSQAGFSESWRM